jgi:DNA repair protein RecO (recombination protein O)
VLRRSNFGEADRLITLLTRDHGKVRAIAKGTRRPTSRHSGNLELFVHSELLLARGRELDILTQSELVHAHRRLREDLVAASHAYYLAEVTDALIEPAEATGSAFELLLAAFSALDRGSLPPLLAAHYLVQLLVVLGYRPELFACLRCGNELRPGRNFLSTSQGGAFCPSCGPTQSNAQPVDSEPLKVLRNLLRTGTPGDLSIAIPFDLAELVDRLVRSFVEQHLERKLRSPEFIQRLRELGDRAAAGLVAS